MVVSSLHSMLILLCVMLCDMSLIPVSIYMFSLGVDVGTINMPFIILYNILLIMPFSSLFGWVPQFTCICDYGDYEGFY